VSGKTFSELHDQRYGLEPSIDDVDGDMASGVAQIVNRRTIRQFEDRPIPEALMTQLLMCAQSGPTKSDLQQYSVIVVDDAAKRAAIAEWIGNMPFIVSASAFVIFCGDIRRNRQLCASHSREHDNDNLDSFFNATVDGTVAMQSFILGSEAAGLACVPVSYIRNHARRVADLCSIPEGVFPIAGVAVGYPTWAGKPSMRLPQSVVVHRDDYIDAAGTDISAYDERRHQREPIDAAKQRNVDRYGASDPCYWSEQISRQLSVPERPDFRDFIEEQGFSLS
jgi:FMN reductase [NAD(P)H]